MNASLFTADRATYRKIGFVFLMFSTAIVGGLFAAAPVFLELTDNIETSSGRHLEPVIYSRGVHAHGIKISDATSP